MVAPTWRNLLGKGYSCIGCADREQTSRRLNSINLCNANISDGSTVIGISDENRLLAREEMLRRSFDVVSCFEELKHPNFEVGNGDSCMRPYVKDYFLLVSSRSSFA